MLKLVAKKGKAEEGIIQTSSFPVSYILVFLSFLKRKEVLLVSKS